MEDQATSFNYNPADYINATAVFCGIKKTILSKNFKGGKITNLFSGTELDFTNADINGIAILDISQAFGETTIVVPNDWRIETDLSQFLSEVDDMRPNKSKKAASDKILVLRGVSMCAGVDVFSN